MTATSVDIAPFALPAVITTGYSRRAGRGPHGAGFRRLKRPGFCWYDPAFLAQLVSGAVKVVVRDGERTVRDLMIR
jgi:hypothetical protein